MNSRFKVQGDWERLRKVWNYTVQSTYDAMMDVYMLDMGYGQCLFFRHPRPSSPDLEARAFFKKDKGQLTAYNQHIMWKHSFAQGACIQDNEMAWEDYDQRVFPTSRYASFMNWLLPSAFPIYERHIVGWCFSYPTSQEWVTNRIDLTVCSTFVEVDSEFRKFPILEELLHQRLKSYDLAISRRASASPPVYDIGDSGTL